MKSEAGLETAGDFSEFGTQLRALIAEWGLSPLDQPVIEKFQAYLALILFWNSRMNLTAVRDPGGIVYRHFLESIACAQALSPEISDLLDFGSGAGFPGIPVALCRPEIAVTLAESQLKKAAFLHEAVRVLGLKTRVFTGRAETLNTRFDCVALRAVDRMEKAVSAASRLVRPEGVLVVMTTGAEFQTVKAAAGGVGVWEREVRIAGRPDQIIAFGRMAPE